MGSNQDPAGGKPRCVIGGLYPFGLKEVQYLFVVNEGAKCKERPFFFFGFSHDHFHGPSHTHAEAGGFG